MLPPPLPPQPARTRAKTAEKRRGAACAAPLPLKRRLIAAAAEVQPPRAAAVRRGVEHSLTRDDLEARDFNVRQPRRGVRPRRGAGGEPESTEVGTRIEVACYVVTDEIVHREIAPVVGPVDP